MRELCDTMQIEHRFLWPIHTKNNAGHFFGRAINSAKIEAMLEKLFPDAVPVLFSSARAGMSASLELLNVSRPDIVWCPPYSSHCVLESVSLRATPSVTDSRNARVALIYHQWGFVHKHNLPSGVTIIEDAVDTFFLPGTNPFAVGGRFTLWSLPKAIATTWGGVVFCRDEEDAKVLRAIRAGRSSGEKLQAILRMASDFSSLAGRYWHGGESLNGGLPDFSLRQIEFALTKIGSIAVHRESLLEYVDSRNISFQIEKGRLPSNIPIEPPSNAENWWGGEGIFSAGLLNLNVSHDYSIEAWKKVAPLPVHQDVLESELSMLPFNQFEGINL